MKRAICDKKLCTGCGACSQICPQRAVMMAADDEGFLHPYIDEELCNDCELCTRTCPINKAIHADKDIVFASTESVISELSVDDNPELQNRAYACYSRDESVRAQSTSGGVFSQLALYIFGEGGVVFGAGFDKDFRVRHAFTGSEYELDGLRRSKYVQSDTGNTFREAKEFLNEGKMVLYCGTPCQIAGLKAYLGREYTGLLTCDLACHGVPSPKVWTYYLDYMKRKYNSPIKAISFRDKATGWKTSSMRIDFENGSRYMDLVQKEIFFIGFGKSIFNRQSCYDCWFRLQNTKADITLADFWGIEQQKEEGYADNHGVSLVITHTAAGEQALKHIESKVICRKKSLEEAVKYNPRLISSVSEPAGRKYFFKDMSSGLDFDRLRAKYMDNVSMAYKAKKILKKILGRG